MISDALEEYNTGHFPEARALFGQAHHMRPSARTLRGLGLTAFELKDYVLAKGELSEALVAQQTPLTTEQRTEVERLLARLRRYTGHLTVEVLTASADVTTALDGRPFTRELDVNLGEHELVVEAPGHATLRRKLSIEGGQTQTLRLHLSPLAIGPRAAAATSQQPTAAETVDAGSAALVERWWFWTALGVVVAGGVVAAVALTAAPNKRPLESGDNGVVINALGAKP